MTPSELKYHVSQTETGKYFFSRETMRFFGDTMKNYGVRSRIVRELRQGQLLPEKILVWELYRKNHVKHGMKGSTFFRKDTFERLAIHDICIVKPQNKLFTYNMKLETWEKLM